MVPMAPTAILLAAAVTLLFVETIAPATGAILMIALGAAVLMLQWLSHRALQRRAGADWSHLEGLIRDIAATKAGGTTPGHKEHPSLHLALIALHQRLAQDGDATRDAVAAIASGVGAISARATELALSLQIQGNTNRESEQSVHRIEDSMGIVAQLAQETEDDSRQVVNLSQLGTEKANEAAGKMHSVSHSIDQSVQQIGALGQSVEKIGGIASIIREIADQTNLLALNAAIEAARAGEQGRGFAVVADEVRKLAERTAGATSEIASVIAHIAADTVKAVSHMNSVTPEIRTGLSQAQSAAELLDQIRQQAGSTLDKMTHLAQTLTEERTHVADVVSRVGQMVQVSDATEAKIRDTSSNTVALENDIERLVALVGRTDAGVGGAATQGAPTTAPLLTWSDALASGYAEIDRQHQRLIELGNQLNAAIRSGHGREIVGTVLEELIDYTAKHFQFEERLMEQHRFPHLDDHRAKHSQLVKEVLAHKARFDAGDTLTAEVMNFIRDWLVNHIMKTDRTLGKFLAER